MKTNPKFFSTLILILILGAVAVLVSEGWDAPISAPSGGFGELRVDASGNVGISSDSAFDPAYKLDIDAGGAMSAGFRATGLSTFVDKLGVGSAAPGLDRLRIADGNLVQDTPANPTVVGELLNLTQRSRGIFVAGRYAYVVFGWTGTPPAPPAPTDRFAIIDITDPKNPQLLGTLDHTVISWNVRDVFVAGRYAYVTGTNFAVIDVSNPANPVLLSSLATSSHQLFVAGRYAYVTLNTNTDTNFKVIDISNPKSPSVVVGTQISPGTPEDVYVSGNYAYVTLAGTGNSVRIVDVTTPSSLTALPATLILPTGAKEIFVSGRYAYVVFYKTIAGEENQGFRIIDISNPANPQLPVGATWPVLPLLMHKIFVSGRYAYVVSENEVAADQFRIIDVNDPLNPQVVNDETSDPFVGTPKVGARNVFVSGRYAYVHFSGPPSAEDTKSRFITIDITGLEAVSASINSLEAGSIQVRDNAFVSNQAYAGGGLNVGIGGILTSGRLTVGSDLFLSSTTSPSGAANIGGLRLRTIYIGPGVDQSCNNICPAPSDCLAAFIGNGNNTGCGDVNNTYGLRCLCVSFGN